MVFQKASQARTPCLPRFSGELEPLANPSIFLTRRTMVWRIKPQDALPLGVIQGFETTLQWFFKKRVKPARRACPVSAGSLDLLPIHFRMPLLWERFPAAITARFCQGSASSDKIPTETQTSSRRAFS
jgi:hypothetical protein